jgi:hypothetical protein
MHLVYLPADFGVDKFRIVFLANIFFTDFRDFLNANNSETVEASQLKLRLFRGSSCRYEPAKSELCSFNGKKVYFGNFDPIVSRGVGVGRPDFDRSMALDEGSMWQRMATKTRTADFWRADERPGRGEK